MVRPSIQKYSGFWKETTYGGSSVIYQLAKNGEIPNTGVDYVEIQPNTELKPHYHTVPSVMVIILEGKGLAYLDGQEFEVEKGDVMTIPPKTVHGFKTQTEGLHFLSIQTPPIYGEDAEKDTHFV